MSAKIHGGIAGGNIFYLTAQSFPNHPTQPASKARSTFIFLSVGGALANQKGLGDFIPRKFELISAIKLFLPQRTLRFSQSSQRYL